MKRQQIIKALGVAWVITCITGCGGIEPAQADHNDDEQDHITRISKVLPHEPLREILSGSKNRTQWDNKGYRAPDDGCKKLKINDPGYLHRVFNDSNRLHLDEARALGHPAIETLKDAWHAGSALMLVKSNENLYIDSLRHSYPYLVPEAYSLLQKIGQAFSDSLNARGGGNYRLKVTSLTRTPRTVSRLRRVNRNASSESAHQYGATFDISYSKFIYDGGGVARTFEDLKNLLGEILLKMREEGYCYVKYERKQACFHITARRPQGAEISQ